MLKGIIFDLDSTLIQAKIDFIEMKKHMIKILEKNGHPKDTLSPTDQTTVMIMECAKEEWGRNSKPLDECMRIEAELEEIMNKGELDAVENLTEIEGAKETIAKLKNKYNFSFSGLKTSVLRYIQKNYPNGNVIPGADVNDIAASFQKAVVDALIQNTEKALVDNDVKSISLVGGVAANKKLRYEITDLSKKYKKKIIIPDPEYCGDNAAMIALRGKYLFEAGRKDKLNINPYPSLGEGYFQ